MVMMDLMKYWQMCSSLQHCVGNIIIQDMFSNIGITLSEVIALLYSVSNICQLNVVGLQKFY